MKLTITIDDKTKSRIDELKDALLSTSISQVIRVAIAQCHQKFLSQNVSIENFSLLDVHLPGMTEAVIKSQMQRFSLSADEYQTIVRDLVDRCAATKTPIKNPEGMIFGACKRYVAERDGKNKPADGGQMPTGDGGKGWLKIQDEMY